MCSARRERALASPGAAQTREGEPINLNIVRKWPEGFAARLQHVWLDVVSFTPNVKLWDLQRVLAEFGLRMEVYEDATPPSHQEEAVQPAGAAEDLLTEIRKALNASVLAPKKPTKEMKRAGREARDRAIECRDDGIEGDASDVMLQTYLAMIAASQAVQEGGR